MKRFLLWICTAAMTASAGFASGGIMQKAGKIGTPYQGLPELRQEVTGKAPGFLKYKKQRIEASGENRLKVVSASGVHRRADGRMKAAPADPDYMPDIYGSVVYSDLEEFEVPALYQLPTAAGGEYVYTIGKADATYGGVAVDGVYYAHNYFNLWGIMEFVFVDAYDIESGEQLASWSGDGSELAVDLAYNPVDKKVYGIFELYDEEGGSASYLGTVTYPSIDDAEGSVGIEYTVPVSGSWNALAIDNAGTFYGISKTMRTVSIEGETQAYTQNSRLYTIDPSTGATKACGTLGATTGEKPYYSSSATFDAASNRLFWTVSSREYSLLGGFKEEGALCELNVKTGKATRLVTYPDGEQICGIYCVAPKSPEAPGVPTDIIADFPAGSRTGTISFKLPTTLFGGAEASGKFGYIVKANNVQIASGTGDPGEAVSVEHTFDENGMVKFSIIATNEAGKSAPAGCSIFVGYAITQSPANVKVVETSPGMVTISWDPVTTDINGTVLPAVTYTVVTVADGEIDQTLAVNITETSFSYQASAPGVLQTSMRYGVFADGEGGESQGTASELVFIGEPYVDFRDTFAGGHLGYDYMSLRNSGSAGWSLLDNSSIQGVSDYSGDNGFIAHIGSYLDDSSSLISGKISLKGIDRPVFACYVYTIVGDNGPAADVIDIAIREPGQEFVSVFNKAVNEIGSTEGWHRVEIDLAAYAGKTIQFRITGTVKMFKYLFIDDILVGKSVSKDVAAAGVAAPARVRAGEEFKATVKVKNIGVSAVSASKVKLYVDDKFYADKDMAGLEAGEVSEVEFVVPMHILAEEPMTLYAEVELDEDEYVANNVSEKSTVAPVVSTMPAVSDLEGTAEGKTVTLTWSEPEQPAVQQYGSTGFEDGGSFAKEYPGWTFVDGDGAIIGGFQNLDLPNINENAEPGTFFVFDASGDDFNQYFAAHGGDKYLAALYNARGTQCDDWAISPEFTGEAQTISFWAKSYSGEYSESFEVMYSTAGVETSAFVSAGLKVSAVPEEWTEYTVKLPEGAKYFAIHYDATDTFMFMLDDFTFEAKTVVPPMLMGFNVYRDGAKVNETLLEECLYNETLAEEGKYVYAVTAVYDKGESKGSNRAEVQIGTSGIEAATAGIVIFAADKAVGITGAEGKDVSVSTIDGKTIFAGEGKSALSVPVNSGVYIVKAGETVAKIIVR